MCYAQGDAVLIQSCCTTVAIGLVSGHNEEPNSWLGRWHTKICLSAFQFSTLLLMNVEASER